MYDSINFLLVCVIVLKAYKRDFYSLFWSGLKIVWVYVEDFKGYGEVWDYFDTSSVVYIGLPLLLLLLEPDFLSLNYKLRILFLNYMHF